MTRRAELAGGRRRQGVENAAGDLGVDISRREIDALAARDVHLRSCDPALKHLDELLVSTLPLPASTSVVAYSIDGGAETGAILAELARRYPQADVSAFTSLPPRGWTPDDDDPASSDGESAVEDGSAQAPATNKKFPAVVRAT
jgi:hypothetical protein